MGAGLRVERKRSGVVGMGFGDGIGGIVMTCGA